MLQVTMTDLHTKWLENLATWDTVVSQALNLRDVHMQGLVKEMEKIRKHALR